MKKKGILLIAVILLSTAGLTQAQEGELGVTLDVTYASRYIWRGIDKYQDNHSAIQPSIDVDLYGTGFGVNVWWSRALGNGFENAEELDFTLSYSSTLFEEEAYQTAYSVGWVYYNFPDNPQKAADMQEVFASLSLPKICPAGVVPSYTIICMWPSVENSTVNSAGGWIHILGLGYDLTVPGILPDTEEQVFNLSAAMVYNGGAGAVGVAHDWSHAVLGVSTDIDLGNNLALTPALYYQTSWENSVNSDDEIWVTLGTSYTF